MAAGQKQRVGTRAAPRAGVVGLGGARHRKHGLAGKGGTTWALALPGTVQVVYPAPPPPPSQIPAGRVAQADVFASHRNHRLSLTQPTTYESAMMVMLQSTTILLVEYGITTDSLTMESIIVPVSPSFLPPTSRPFIDLYRPLACREQLPYMQQDAHSLQHAKNPNH